jgi:hypothetical protein
MPVEQTQLVSMRNLFLCRCHVRIASPAVECATIPMVIAYTVHNGTVTGQHAMLRVDQATNIPHHVYSKYNL